jgi:hypothetical protein
MSHNICDVAWITVAGKTFRGIEAGDVEEHHFLMIVNVTPVSKATRMTDQAGKVHRASPTCRPRCSYEVMTCAGYDNNEEKATSTVENRLHSKSSSFRLKY